MTDTILELREVTKTYAGRLSGLGVRRTWVHALRGVSLVVHERDDRLGLVGESGSGKSTLGRLALGLETPTGGQVMFRGVALTAADRHTRRQLRSEVKAVFQDPFSSLDPRMRIRDIIEEPLVTARVTKDERVTRVAAALELVGLGTRVMPLHPHHLSGGMRQRVAIARAVITNPRLIVLDEPVSALDVSIRGQILNLLRDIQAERSMSFIMIGHDVPTMAFACDRLMVMFAGRIVEQGVTETLISDPQHPYTQALLDSVPRRATAGRASRSSSVVDANRQVGTGPLPESGCRYRRRCLLAKPICEVEDPPLVEMATGQTVACHVVTGGA
jgi:peptide/nickel transport system ATP-binding protein